MGVVVVSAGGALGALARWAVGDTFWVNVSGCLLIGVVLGLLAERPLWRLFLSTGFLGGYTTFSAYAVERLSILSTAGTLLCCLGAAWLGHALTRRPRRA